MEEKLLTESQWLNIQHRTQDFEDKHLIVIPEWIVRAIKNNNLDEAIRGNYGIKSAEDERNTLKSELLQRFNDYETPLKMTAEEVREIISNYK